MADFFHLMTPFVMFLHVASGAIGLVSGTIAMAAHKGGRVHRAAGNVFFASMLVMAVFAAYLGVAIPDQIVNVFIAILVTYLLATAWLTVRRRPGSIGLGEKIAVVVAILLCAPFAILSVQLAMGLAPLFKSAVPFEGPVLIAVYVFTAVLAIAAISDASVVLSGGISGAARIARHLWRMSLGLAMAAGSAFHNGLPRLLPSGVHVPFLILSIPQLTVLALLIFWLVRVRITGWYKKSGEARAGVKQSQSGIAVAPEPSA